MKTLAILLALLVAPIAACGVKEEEPARLDGRKVFEDHFDAAGLADHWLDTSDGGYSIRDGKLRVQGARNRPLWLKTKLPDDARIEFTAVSKSPAVDIKVEAWGDGVSFAKTASYTATSYVFILGGWNNTRSIIARMNEHGDDRKERLKPLGEQGREYRFSIRRQGGELSWELDGAPFLGFTDDAPLRGAGHEHFAFNNWASEVWFDDLVIHAL